MTLSEHSQCVYGSVWSPHDPFRIASCSGDGTAKIWDVRHHGSAQTIMHGGEVLSLDFAKYTQNCIVTAGVDTTLKLWDLRNSSSPMQVLGGHEMAVRRVKFSPHNPDILASVSYGKRSIYSRYDYARVEFIQ